MTTGAKIEITGGDKPYAEMLHDESMAVFYRKNSEALGKAPLPMSTEPAFSFKA